MKKCSECKILKEKSEFSKEKGRSDGLNPRCKNCCSIYYKKWLDKNREKRNQYQKNYYLNEKKESAIRHAIYYIEHKQEINLQKSLYKKNKSGKINSLNKKYQASKMERTPSWLTQEHFRQMEEVYVLAEELQWLSENKLVVDHIIPMQGKDVCGLHVPWNLQI